MAVLAWTVSVGKRYKRFGELRTVVNISNDDIVEYEFRMKTDSGGEAVGMRTMPLARFAEEVDVEVR